MSNFNISFLSIDILKIQNLTLQSYYAKNKSKSICNLLTKKWTLKLILDLSYGVV